jgi:glutathione synthase/RimK-type ligase-like ATP-grasp enzyme
LIKQKPYLIYEKVKNKSWKHNLSQGAKVNIILSKPLKTKLSTLALNAAKAININFCAVDIIQVDNKLMILEINSGLMFEQFSQIKPNLQIVNHIYRTILKYMFNIN